MTILPPSFSFDGDKKKAISLKAHARQLYNFVTNQAELSGVSFVNKNFRLQDGSTISIRTNKEKNYNNRTGAISIFGNIIPTKVSDINSKLFMHGYIKTVLNSEYVVYDGSKPTIFTNSIPLTNTNTLSRSIKDKKGFSRKTFNKWNDLGDDGVIVFGGAADYHTANYTIKGDMGIGVGCIRYNGLEYEVPNSYIFDARVSNDIIYVLYGTFKVNSSSGNSLVFATYKVGNNRARTDWFYITTSISSNIVTITGTKYEIGGQNFSTATLATFNNSTKPTGAKLINGSPVFGIVDARFSLDCTKVCFLTNISQLWYMESGVAGTITSFSHSDLTNTFGGMSRYVSSIDITIRLDKTISMAPAVLTTDSFTFNSKVLPFTKTEYLRRCSELKHTITPTVTFSHYLDSYPGCDYFSSIFSSKFIGGGDPKYAYEQYETEADLLSNIFEPWRPGGSYKDFSWSGGISYQWNPTGIGAPLIDHMGRNGTASRQYTYTPTDSVGNPIAPPQIGILNVPVSRAVKTLSSVSGTFNIEIVGSGTYFCAYSFDTDPSSLTHGSRSFVEIGYKTPSASHTIFTPNGSIGEGAHNFVNSITLKVTVNNISDEAINSVSQTFYDYYPVLVSEAMGYYGGVSSSYTKELIGNGGTISEGIYVGDVLIGRYGDSFSFPDGYKEVHTIGYSFVYSPEQYTPNVSYIPGRYTLKPTSLEVYSLPECSDVMLSYSYPYQSNYSSNYDLSSNSVRYEAAGFNYDLKTGSNTVTVNHNTTFTKINTNPNKTGMTSTLSTVKWKDYKDVYNVSKISFVNGNEYAYESVSETIGDWVQVPYNTGNRPENRRYTMRGYIGTDSDYSEIIDPFSVFTNTVLSTYISGDPIDTIMNRPNMIYSQPYSFYYSEGDYSTPVNGCTFLTSINYLGSPVEEIVAGIPIKDTQLNSSKFPTKISQIPRSDIAVIDPLTGTIKAQSVLFPDGNNPNTPENAYTKYIEFGVTEI